MEGIGIEIGLVAVVEVVVEDQARMGWTEVVVVGRGEARASAGAGAGVGVRVVVTAAAAVAVARARMEWTKARVDSVVAATVGRVEVASSCDDAGQPEANSIALRIRSNPELVRAGYKKEIVDASVLFVSGEPPRHVSQY